MDQTIYDPPDCAACDAIPRQTVATWEDEWQVKLLRIDVERLQAERRIRQLENDIARLRGGA